MKITSNEATSLRPHGDRLLNAFMVEMDLYKCIDTIKSESTWNQGDRSSMTIFKSDITTVLVMGLHKNAEMKAHTAKGQIFVQVLKGHINFHTEARDLALKQGQMIALQENISHSVLAIEESFFLLTVSTAKSEL